MISIMKILSVPALYEWCPGTWSLRRMQVAMPSVTWASVRGPGGNCPRKHDDNFCENCSRLCYGRLFCADCERCDAELPVDEDEDTWAGGSRIKCAYPGCERALPDEADCMLDYEWCEGRQEWSCCCDHREHWKLCTFAQLDEEDEKHCVCCANSDD